MQGGKDDKLKLLPRSHDEFAKKDYWDQFFHDLDKKGVKKSSGDETGAFEWYGTWTDLKDSVDFERRASLCGKKPEELKILVIGCGNSTLSEDMYNDGFKSIVSIDFSEVVIDEMKKKTAGKAGLEFVLMDMLKMDSNWTESFDIVFDKGALDALVSEDKIETLENGRKMFAEISRVLKKGGLYLAVTLAQEHVQKLLFEFFNPEKKFGCHVFPFEPKSGSVLLPFMICFQKDSPSDQVKLFVAGGQSEISVAWETLQSVMDDRRLVYHMQKKIKEGGKGILGKFSLEGMDTLGAPSPRFFLTVLDSGLSQRTARIPCAVFIVPQGREHEWMFSSEEGQMSIASGNGIGRLITVGLGRGHEFASMQQVQQEISPAVVPLVPDDLRHDNSKIPFMTVGPDLGSRTVVGEVSSPSSGTMIIEDVKVTDEITKKEFVHRRLVFKNSADVVQSEARLSKKKFQQTQSKGKSNKKKKGKSNNRKADAGSVLEVNVDRSFLAFEFHRAMVAGLLLTSPKKWRNQDAPAKFVVAGLGGGALASYLSTECEWLCPETDVEAVELDPSVVEVAEKWFGFNNSQSSKVIKVHLGDGAQFLGNLSESAGGYRAIFVDVDAKDLSQPVLFPPMPFLDSALLTDLKEKVLAENYGVVVLNVASKSSTRQKEILASLAELFPLVLAISMQAIGDNNCVVFALNRSFGDEATKMDFAKAIVTEARRSASELKVAHDFEEILSDAQLVSKEGDLVEFSK